MNEPKHRSGLSPDEYRKLTGFEGDWRDSWWADDFLALMVRRWRIAGATSLLDVGCGVGHWGQRLMRFLPDAQLTGVDAEVSWMQEARERAARQQLQATYQVANGEQLPFADDTFDVATCQTVLMHVSDPLAVLREMRRVVKPGGMVIAAEPNNFANVASRCVALPGVPFPIAAALLELHHTLTAGKIALGEGDQSIGEKLPHYFALAELKGIATAMNPQTAPSLPPYDAHTGGRERSMRQDWASNGRMMELGGTHDNARRMFLAGGGSDARFDELVATALANDAGTLAAYDAQTCVTSGGHLHYLVSGRKADN